MTSTGFDAFFDSVSQSKDFQASVIHNRERLGMKRESTVSLDDPTVFLEAIKKDLEQTESILGAFQSTFDTPEVRQSANKRQDVSASEAQNEMIPSTDPKKQTGNPTPSTQTIQIEKFEVKNPKTHGFLGVAGMESLKTELREGFIQPLRFYFQLLSLRKKKESEEMTEAELSKLATYESLYEAYSAYQVSIPTGLLFYGPPGTGKTYIAKKLAEELGAGFIAKSMGEFGSSYVHQTSKNVHEFFEAAKQASHGEPVMLFLDEIDSLVSKRTGNVDAQKAEEVSQFLQEFNALEAAPNLIVVAATNRPDHLDTAILRSGRLDKKYYIGPPDEVARKELFMIHIEKKGRPHEELDYQELAKLTEGYVASDIEAICDEVARDASRHILEEALKLENLDGKDMKTDGITEKKKGITMELIRKALQDTPTSLRMEDIIAISAWESSI